jgi:RNA polymerase sigma-70 factor (ECF subfamily)
LLEQLCQPARNQAAWQHFVLLYGPLLCRWSRRWRVPRQDREDFLQEVFGHLATKMPAFRYDARKSFRCWLWTVALNVWRHHRRKRKGPELHGDLDKVAEADGRTEADEREDAEHRHHLLLRLLKHIEHEFSSQALNAFRLYALEDRPARDVAHGLGVSVAAVLKVKSRVLGRLRQVSVGLID